MYCQDGYLNPSGLDPSLVEGQGFPSKVRRLITFEGSKVRRLTTFEGSKARGPSKVQRLEARRRLMTSCGSTD